MTTYTVDVIQTRPLVSIFRRLKWRLLIKDSSCIEYRHSFVRLRYWVFKIGIESRVRMSSFVFLGNRISWRNWKLIWNNGFSILILKILLWKRHYLNLQIHFLFRMFSLSLSYNSVKKVIHSLIYLCIRFFWCTL